MQSNIALKSLQPIMILRFISTVTFGVFYSSLSLLMIQAFNLTNEMAASITVLFFALHYSLPILGGFLGGSFTNFKQLFIIGKTFQLLSAFVLTYSIYHNQYLFLGLSLFLVDSMVNVVSLNMLITNRFDSSDTDARALAFLKGHVWSNYGFIAAFLLSGTVYCFVDIRYLFYICACFSVITILHCFFYIEDNQESNFIKLFKVTLIMLFITILLTRFVENHYLSREIILLVSSLTIVGVFTWTIKKVNKMEKESIITFWLFMMCSIVFWSIYMLGPTFLPIFIKDGFNADFFGIIIPPQWLHMICPISTVTLGTLLSQNINKMIEQEKEKMIRRSHLFISGLMCTVVALLILYYLVKNHSLGISSNCMWLIAYIVILATGEILLAPASMALIGDYIPKKYQGIYTGINQMTIGLSVILSGVLLQQLLLPAYELGSAVTNYYISNFIYLAAIVFGLVVMLFIFDKVPRKSIA